MAQIKCTECGQIFDENLKQCPNCGCPASECKPIEDSTEKTENTNTNNSEPKQTINANSDFTHRTTDTGYQQEETIKRYADILLSIAKFFAILILAFAAVIFLNSLIGNFSVGYGIGIAFWGVLSAGLIYVAGILTKAFLYIYANISLNIHEINMKLK